MVKIFKSKYKLMKLQISLLVLLILFVYLHKTRENFYGFFERISTTLVSSERSPINKDQLPHSLTGNLGFFI